MTAPSTKELVDSFTQKINDRLDQSKLEGPVRLDNTHTVVIIPLKDGGPIHAHLDLGVNDESVDNVMKQIQMVPTLKGLVKQD